MGKFKIGLMRILLSAFMSMPLLANAVNLFEPVKGDKSVEILKSVFGNLGSFGASSSDALGAVFATFLSGVMILAGVLIAYTIFVGTVGTAHDGEMLGKKFSSAWVPIRTAMGSALVMPVIGGQYCIMQAIVGWLIVQGVGLADNVWTTYTKAENLTQTVQTTLEPSEIKSTTWDIASSLVCLKGYEKIYSDAKANASSVYPDLAFKAVTTATANGAIIRLGADGMGFSPNSCGQVLITNTDRVNATALIANGSLVGELGNINSAIDNANKMQVVALNEMINSLSKSAQSFVNGGSIADLEKAVELSSVNYSARMKEVSAPVLSKLGNFEQLAKSASQDGWLLGGAWYMRIAMLYDTAQAGVAKVPSATGAKGRVNQTFDDEFNVRFSSKLSDLRSTAKDGTEFGIASSIDQSEGTSTGLWESIKSAFSFDTAIKKVFKAFPMATNIAGEHPIMQMKRMGNALAIGGSAMYLKYGAVVTGAGTIPSVGSNFATATLPLALLIFPMIMICAFLLSWVLPMMPFVIWIGAVIGWIILCIEALIAAPIWAVMHLSPQGDDLVGTAGQGYRLVLSLILRPVLMVFGLISALTLITVIGQLINKVYWDVFVLSQQDSNILILLMGLIASPMIYFGINWQLINMTMKVIHMIPDQLLQWFGGGGSQLGEHAQSMGGSSAQTYAVGTAIGNIAGKGLDMKKQLNDTKKHNDQIDEQKQGNLADRQNRVNNAFGAINSKLGNGSSSVIAKALENNGRDITDPNALHSYESQNMQSMMTSANKSLGGQDSAEAEQYREELEENVSNGMNFHEAHTKALSNALDSKYGDTAGQFLSSSSDGKLTGSGFAKGVEQLKSIQNLYRDLSPSEVKRKTVKAISVASQYAEKNKVSISSAMDKMIDHAYEHKNKK